MPVLHAAGLRAADYRTSDPYVVVELGNTRHRTETVRRTLDPVWKRAFVFPIRDIYGHLDVTVLDEDRGGRSDFLGKVEIPLLSVRAGPQRYVLKNRTVTAPAKGEIVLNIKVEYSIWKALILSIARPEVKYLAAEEPFKCSLLVRNVVRIKKIAMAFISFGSYASGVFCWESYPRTLLVWTVRPAQRHTWANALTALSCATAVAAALLVL